MDELLLNDAEGKNGSFKERIPKSSKSDKGKDGSSMERVPKSQNQTTEGEVKSSQTDLAPKEATKGKKWKNFDDPELEAEYKAKHKARSKAKKAKLKERRPQRVDCRCFHNFHS